MCHYQKTRDHRSKTERGRSFSSSQSWKMLFHSVFPDDSHIRVIYEINFFYSHTCGVEPARMSACVHALLTKILYRNVKLAILKI